MPEIQILLDNKPLLSMLSAIFGVLVAAIVNYIRNDLRTLEYQVHHERVAVAANDTIFGDVRVTWQGTEVKNLFVSTAILENATTRDFSNLKIKVHTDNTLLLTQYVELVGTSYVPPLTDEYIKFLAVQTGENPTPEQYNTYYHKREFLISTLNRGQKFLARFLVTDSNNDPSVWIDALHAGVKLRFRPNQKHFLGVPVRITLPVALGVCFIVLILSSLYLSTAWIAGILCMLVGLFAQIIAAVLYRTSKKIYNIFLG
jgi:small basic protein